MTIAVCCTLADGVVLGADSAITVRGGLPDAEGRVRHSVLKVYRDAEKVFALHQRAGRSDLPIGIVTYGLAYLGNRTLASFIRQFEIGHDLDTLGEMTLEQLATQLHRFFREKYVEHVGPAVGDEEESLDDVPTGRLPLLGIYLAGFSPNQALPEAWQINVQFPEGHEDRPAIRQVRTPGDFGSNWGGQFDGVQRFHKGYQPELLQAVVNAVVEHLEIPQETIQASEAEIAEVVGRTIAEFEYQVPFAAMPLQEGIDYVKFLTDMMISQTRFVIGAPTCDGPVRIAVIRKYEGFEWVSPRGFQIRVS